jgi:hypothetical protein
VVVADLVRIFYEEARALDLQIDEAIVFGGLQHQNLPELLTHHLRTADLPSQNALLDDGIPTASCGE